MTTVAREASGASAAWLRAFALTAPIARAPHRLLPTVIDELADRCGDAPALLSDSERLSYRTLAGRAHQYARWALDQGIGRGDTVGLLMPNRPEYVAIWLGITSVGGGVALLNTQARGPGLAHALAVVAPRHVIVAAELVDVLTSAGADATGAAKIWVHGRGADAYARIDAEIACHAGDPLDARARPPVTIEDPALYIYTSGTTGLPKAARVSHFRLMQWSHWFAGLMDLSPDDRMYDCLPLYHSVGGVVAVGAPLAAGASVAIGRRFSARRFWDDVVRWDCTLIQYIGELCRYLLQGEPRAVETVHRLRLACGNGLRGDIWLDFQRRFRIPRILEFYAATEGNVSFFNLEGRPGAVGRVPPLLAHRAPVAIVRFEVEAEAPVRDADGRCVRCPPGAVGEVIGQVLDDPSRRGTRFEGYTSEDASRHKILRDVFAPGDAWFRTGDLMRRDADGYFYFVDRIGDTFRWKGENVSTAEVEDALCAFPGIRDASVYGVPVPGADGRVGMAAVAVGAALDLAALRAHLAERLPAYARPRFLRVRRELELTATFKRTKHDLRRQGFDPEATDDALFFDDHDRDGFVPIDAALYLRIQSGTVHL